MQTISLRRFLVVCVLALALGVAACSVGDDDADDASADATTTTAMAEAGGTATSSGPIVAMATATATTQPATATPRPSPTITPTATREPTATATVELAAPLGEIVPLDPNALTNFSLNFTMEMRGVPNQADYQMALRIQQSAVDNYYLLINSAGANIETWLVDGSTYLRQEDGTIVETPGGVDTGLVSPSMFLASVPAIGGEVEGFREGEEDVNGRRATHYRIPGEEILSLSGFLGENPDVRDVTGNADVWIDNEWRILIKQQTDITWRNADGTEGALKYDYLVDQIGSTPRVEAPR